jgi:hypothetical protein
VKKRESLDETIETLDQMVELHYRVLRLLKGLYDEAVKPGSIVFDETNIVDDGSG